MSPFTNRRARGTSAPRSALPLAMLVGLCLGAGGGLLHGLTGSAQAAPPPVPQPVPMRLAEQVTDGELSDADRKIYLAAFAAADSHHFDGLNLILAPLQDRRLVPVLTWLKILRRQAESPEVVEAFLDAFPDFPSRNALVRRLEDAVLATEDPDRIRAFFATRPPLTTGGRLELAILKHSTDPAGAVATARRLWRERDLELQEEKRLLATFADALTADDHAARLDHLLWDGHRAAANRMKRYLTADQRRLMDARLQLRYRRPGVDAAVERVPPALQNDPGLLYERTRWRRRAGMDRGAQDLLFAVRDQGARPDLWWVERRIQVRELIAGKRFDDAYRVAAGHGLKHGAGFAQGEFEAGWLALRFLDQPGTALRHFETLYDGVSYPVSRARGAYWIARAHLALGAPDKARRWFVRAAMNATTYYGQLAALELDDPTLVLPSAPPVSRAAMQDFQRRPLVQITRLLTELGQIRLAKQFISHMAQNGQDYQDLLLLAGLTRTAKVPHLQVLAGKLAALKDLSLPSIAYPLLADLRAQDHIDPALAHAIGRQESAFDPTAISSAGARGLMQLMPATAKLMAQQTEVAWQPRRLIEDPAYNARLGSAYLRNQIADFDGYLPMAIAAYNAGPHRVRRWITQYGDPRTGEIDPIDWVELIPFSETRNYVQRVLEGLQVFRLMEGEGFQGRNRLFADLGLRTRFAVLDPPTVNRQ